MAAFERILEVLGTLDVITVDLDYSYSDSPKALKEICALKFFD